ncbi:hypothetical protein JHK87_010612 [Glycine soja]|nr:hypothetical protein JHK87_010612 [Glycine soja]
MIFEMENKGLLFLGSVYDVINGDVATTTSANIVSMVLEFLTELLGAQFPFVNSLRRTGKLEAGARRRVHGEEKERSRVTLVQEFPKRPGDSECSYFLKTGHSRFKSNCKFHHPKDWIATLPPCNLNDKGVPLRPPLQNLQIWTSFYVPPPSTIARLDQKLVNTNSAASADVAENGGGEAEVVELGDCTRHAAKALVIGEVIATLEEIIEDVEGGRDSEVVVVGKGNRVDKGGAKRVDGVFVSETQHELGLRADLHDSDRVFWGISQKINTISNGDYSRETK